MNAKVRRSGSNALLRFILRYLRRPIGRFRRIITGDVWGEFRVALAGVAVFARRHYGLEKCSVHKTLRRPGLPGVCRAYPAASDSIGTYEDVGAVLITLGTSSVPSFRFSISVPRGPAIDAIRTSPGCFPFERKIFPPALLPYRGAPRGRLRLTESQHHQTCNAYWPV